jgi:hypothetical protein
MLIKKVIIIILEYQLFAGNHVIYGYSYNERKICYNILVINKLV